MGLGCLFCLLGLAFALGVILLIVLVLWLGFGLFLLCVVLHVVCLIILFCLHVVKLYTWVFDSDMLFGALFDCLNTLLSLVTHLI